MDPRKNTGLICRPINIHDGRLRWPCSLIDPSSDIERPILL
jgi:hypothetical protein